MLIAVGHRHFVMAELGPTIHATAEDTIISMVRADVGARVEPGNDDKGAVFGHVQSGGSLSQMLDRQTIHT